MTGPDRTAGATSIRRLLDPGADDEELTRGMTAKLPAEGMAAGRTRSGSPLLLATYRLLDSKVLLAAARCLDQDVAGPVAAWLATYQELRAAAARTLADPEAEELVVLTVPRRLVAPQDVVVRVVDDHGAPLGTFPFRLLLAADLGRTQVVVREGAVHQVDCAAAELEASLTFADVSPPLWQQPWRPMTLHLPLPRPIPVALRPVPPPRRHADGEVGSALHAG